MTELLSLLGGGVFRLLPEVFKLFQAKRDQDHELRMTQLQLEIDKARSAQSIDRVHAEGAMVELQGWVDAIKAQSRPTGFRAVDFINATVRPFLTYYHLIFIYTAVKIALLYGAIAGGIAWYTAIADLYTEADRALAWSMASFWFVDRSLRVK